MAVQCFFRQLWSGFQQASIKEKAGLIGVTAIILLFVISVIGNLGRLPAVLSNPSAFKSTGVMDELAGIRAKRQATENDMAIASAPMPASEPVADRAMMEGFSSPGAGGNAVGQTGVVTNPIAPVLTAAAEEFKPQIIKTANMAVTVENVEKAMFDLEALVVGHRGIITNQQLSLAQQGGQRYGSLEVRVPEANLGQFLMGSQKVGTITNLTQTGEDVSAEMVDLDSRIKTLKAQENQLLDIMKRSGKVAEVLQVAQELGRVRGEIEQNQGQLNYYRQKVSYATVTIQLSEKYNAPDSGEPGFLTIMKNTFDKAAKDLYHVGVGLAAGLIGFVVFWLPILFGFAVVCRLCWAAAVAVWRKIFPDKQTPAKSSTTEDTPTDG